MAAVRAWLFGLAAGGAVLGCLGACSGTVGAAKSDAGRDGNRSDGDSPADYPAADRVVDAAVCTPFALATDCLASPEGECQPTWADALAHPTCLWAGGPFGSEVRGDCGPYHVRKVNLNERGVTYAYDIASGALVAINGCPLGNASSCGCSVPLTVDCSNTIFTPACTYDGGGVGDGDGGNCYAGFESNGFDWNTPCARDGGTDAGAACYASCEVSFYGAFKYVGCVSGSSLGTMCYASCSDCP